jgi:hypothetical protein
MIRYKETLDAHLKNGLDWQIEKDQNQNLNLTILWANGEELETIDLTKEDIETLSNLFIAAKNRFIPIVAIEKKKGANK